MFLNTFLVTVSALVSLLEPVELDLPELELQLEPVDELPSPAEDIVHYCVSETHYFFAVFE